MEEISGDGFFVWFIFCSFSLISVCFIPFKGETSWGKGLLLLSFRKTGEVTKAGSSTKWWVASWIITINWRKPWHVQQARLALKLWVIFWFQVQLGFARLQSIARSRQLHLNYKKRREAALVLQTQIRGYLARKEWKRKRNAVILLQAHTRGVLARKKLTKMKRDVSLCQRVHCVSS